MFDTVLGLPVHALVVHGVVVLLPLMALATIAVAFVPPLRRFAWLAVAGNAGVTAMAYVARQSGYALYERLGEPAVAANHGSLGSNLVWFALGLFVASVLVAMARASTRSVPAGIVAGLAAALAVFWTVRVGHTGTEAVWAEIVRNTQAP